jgi:hypothetical protein
MYQLNLIYSCIREINATLIQILIQFTHFLSFIVLWEGTLVGYNVVGHLDHSQNLYVCLFECDHVVPLPNCTWSFTPLLVLLKNL